MYLARTDLCTMLRIHILSTIIWIVTHCVGWVVAMRYPGLVLICKEARVMDDANTDVDDVIVRDGLWVAWQG